MTSWTKTIIWLVVVFGAFIYLWRTGQLMRLRNYIAETREELKKCTWPTWNELKGSTVVVLISIGLLGVFTVVSDWLFGRLIYLIT